MTQTTETRPKPSDRLRTDKHHAITQAAAEMFLAEGFARASVEQIAHRAGVSKQTIYAHFTDKEALFRAICGELTEQLTVPLKLASQKNQSLREILLRLGEDCLVMAVKPATLDLHRLVLDAAARFPDLGRAAYEAGPARMIAELAALFAERSRSGEWHGGAPETAAEQFVGMVTGLHQLRALLGKEPVTPAARKAYVGSCVALILG